MTAPSLATASSSDPKLVYLDALNFGTKIFFKSSCFWDVKSLRRNVAAFVAAAKRSDLCIVAFLDGGGSDKESQETWRKRREQEVDCSSRRVPQGFPILLGDAFREEGVEVHYTVDAPCLETMAIWAQMDGATVLSGNKNFVRYRDRKFRIFHDFQISDKQGIVLCQENFDKGHWCKGPLSFPSQKHKTASHHPFTAYEDPSQPDKLVHLRGVASDMVKQHGNLFIYAQPLRQALYARLGIDEVIEEFPFWDAKCSCVKWHKALVKADNRLDFLLDRPEDAVVFLFGLNSVGFNIAPPSKPVDPMTSSPKLNHVFSMFSTVFSICAEASAPAHRQQSVLSRLEEICP
jgi:hypothetical protein